MYLSTKVAQRINWLASYSSLARTRSNIPVLESSQILEPARLPDSLSYYYVFPPSASFDEKPFTGLFGEGKRGRSPSKPQKLSLNAEDAPKSRKKGEVQTLYDYVCVTMPE